MLFCLLVLSAHVWEREPPLGREGAARAEMANLAVALEAYLEDVGDLPTVAQAYGHCGATPESGDGRAHICRWMFRVTLGTESFNIVVMPMGGRRCGPPDREWAADLWSLSDQSALDREAIGR